MSTKKPRRSQSRLSLATGGSVVFPCPVVVDTRERLPYRFANLVADKRDGGGRVAVAVETDTLASGDYSLRGFETRVAVERKSLGDLYGTLGKGRDRFGRELERLSVYDFACVVIEAEWSDILGSPPPRSRLPPKTVFRSILAWQQRYCRVHWLTMPGRGAAEVATFRILERFWKEQQAPQKEPQ